MINTISTIKTNPKILAIIKSIRLYNLSPGSSLTTMSMWHPATLWEISKTTHQMIDIRPAKTTFSSNKTTPKIWPSALFVIMDSKLRKEAISRQALSISAKPRSLYNRLKISTSWTNKRHQILQKDQKSPWLRRLHRKNKRRNNHTSIKLSPIILNLMILLALRSLISNPLKKRLLFKKRNTLLSLILRIK